MNKVYICGKVTGEERSAVVQKFKDAEMLLVFNNWEPVNPTELVPENTPWNEAMRICIRAMMDCTHIYLLSDYKESKGARIELRLSKALKIKQLQKKHLCLV